MALCPVAPAMARISLPAYNAEALVYLSCPVRGGEVAFQDKYQQALLVDCLDLVL